MNSEKNIYKDFGLLIKNRREQKKLSQNDLADRLGITKSSYGLYERGERKVPLSHIMRLAAILDFNVDEFFRSQRDLTSNENQRILWDEEFAGIDWSESEAEQIREFARFILAKRGMKND